MFKKDVLAHFGSGVAVARALGVTKSAVSQWKRTVPLQNALHLQLITNGALTVDMALYQRPDLPSKPHRGQRREAV